MHKCKYCNERFSGKYHYCPEEERSFKVGSDNFLLSALIGAATDSAILGGLLGGDIAGGIVGDILDGDLFD